jgi:hypothetical protein
MKLPSQQKPEKLFYSAVGRRHQEQLQLSDRRDKKKKGN